DFSFKEAVAARLPAVRLPAFFATFHLITNAVSLLLQLFGVGWLIGLTGVGRAPVVLPALLLLGLASTALTGGLIGVILLRGLDGAARSSFHRPTFELLQVALDDRVRRKAKSLIDVIGLRGGQAFAALALLSLSKISVGPGVRLALVAVLLSLWWVVAFGLGRRYVDLLRSALLRAGPTRSLDAGPDQVPLAATLGALGGEAAVAALVGMLGRREGRAAARAALARIPGSFEAVEAVLTNPRGSLAVRSSAPRALAEIAPA